MSDEKIYTHREALKMVEEAKMEIMTSIETEGIMETIHHELIREGDLREGSLDRAMEEGNFRAAMALGLLAISMRLKAIDFTLNQPGNPKAEALDNG